MGEQRVRVIGNGIVNIHKVLPNVDLSKLHFKEEVNYEVLKNIINNPVKLEEMKKNTEILAKRHSTEDICKTIL